MSRRGSRMFPLVFGCAVSLSLIIATSGCAIHYRNAKTGVEHLWGLGQLRLKIESTGTPGPFVTVSAGCRVPGLCLDVGRGHFGFTLGYLDRQQLVVLASNQIGRLQLPTNSVAGLWARDVNSRWAFGHLRMRGVGSAENHQAIITGRALAGLGAGVGGGDTSLGLAYSSRQLAEVKNEDVFLQFDQSAPRWPGFDLFTMKVNAFTAEDVIGINPATEP